MSYIKTQLFVSLCRPVCNFMSRCYSSVCEQVSYWLLCYIN